MRVRLWVVWVACAVAVSACGDDDETAIDAVVSEADPQLVRRIDTVRISITRLDRDGRTSRVTEIPAEHVAGRMIAVTERLRPDQGDESDSLYRVRAEGLVDDQPIISVQHRLTFVRGRIVAVPLRFTQPCVDVSCDDQTTCIAGACVSDFVPACVFDRMRDPECESPFEPTTMDASTVDAGRDATASDANARDDAAEPMGDATTTDGASMDATTGDGALADASTSDGAGSDATSSDGGGMDATMTDGGGSDATMTDGGGSDATMIDAGGGTDATMADGGADAAMSDARGMDATTSDSGPPVADATTTDDASMPADAGPTDGGAVPRDMAVRDTGSPGVGDMGCTCADDGDPCTSAVCPTCTPVPVDPLTPCDDGLACTESSFCTVGGSCTGAFQACMVGRMCMEPCGMCLLIGDSCPVGS